MVCLIFSIVFYQKINAQYTPDSKLIMDPSVKIGKLPNGFSYLIKKNAKPADKAAMRLVVNVGSFEELDQEQGIAHLLEHLAFNGSKNFTKNDVVKYLESIGLTFGGDLNASTDFFNTIYELEVPTDRKGALDSSFLIFEDFAHQLLLEDDDIENEKDIVQKERSLRNSAALRVAYEELRHLFTPLELNKRFPIGDAQVIDTVHPNTIRAFYKKWYQPQNMALVIVGDFNESDIVSLIQKHFGHIPAGTGLPARRDKTLKFASASEVFTIEDGEATSNTVTIAFTPAVYKNAETVGELKKNVVENIAVRILNERFSEIIRTKSPPFVSMGLSRETYVAGNEFLYLKGNFGEKNPEEAVQFAMLELLKWQKFGVSANEFNRVKENTLSSLSKALAEKSNTNSNQLIESYISWFSRGEIVSGIDETYKLYQYILNNTTPAEINQYISSLHFEKFKVIFAGKDIAGKINNDQIIAAVQNTFKQELVANQEEALPDHLLPQALKAGKIVKETVVDAALKIKRWDLSNGLSVFVQSTDYKQDEILFAGERLGGYNRFTAKDAYQAQNMASLIGTMGFGAFTPTQLNKFLAGKEVGVVVNLTDNTDMIRGTAVNKDLKTLFELIQLMTLYPRNDANLFNNTLNNFKQRVNAVVNNPEAVFVDSFMRTYYNNNPYMTPVFPHPDQLAQLNNDAAYAMFKDVFSSFDGFKFSIVGSFNEDSLKSYVATYLAALPVSKQNQKAAAKAVWKTRPIEGPHEIVFKRGTQDRAQIITQSFYEAPYSRKKVITANLLSSVLTQRTTEVLREELKAIYASNVTISVAKYPVEKVDFSYVFPTTPAQVDLIRKEWPVLMNEIKEKGPSETALQAAKSQYLNSLNTSRKENAFWHERLKRFALYGDPMQTPEQNIELLNSITGADLQELLKEILSHNNSTTGIFLPEDKSDN